MPRASKSAPIDFTKISRRWMLAFVFLGLFVRLFRYALPIPIPGLVDSLPGIAQGIPLNGDEAAVGLNIINRSYLGLLKPLDYGQVAPIGFLWVERAVYDLSGMSEHAMRAVPTLAGMAAVILFAYWAWRLVEPMAAAIATGILAVGFYSVFHAVELKPYSFDLLASIALLLPATRYLADGNAKWLILILVMTPIAMFFSYPSIFVIGGIELMLLASSRSASRQAITWTVLIGAVCLAGFAFEWKAVAGQYDKTQGLMQVYWQVGEAFPPYNPFKLLLWLIEVHTGNLFAYPFGGKNFASSLSFLLFIVGVVYWFRSGRSRLAMLLLSPFALTLLAAFLRRYPYGEAARVTQHLAPIIILFMGIGSARLIDRVKSSDRARYLVHRVVCLVLVGISIGVLATAIKKPGTADHQRAKEIAQQLLNAAPADTTVAVLQPMDSLPANMQWYLRQQQQRIVWDAANRADWKTPNRVFALDWQPVDEPADKIWQDEQKVERLLGRYSGDHEMWIIAPMGGKEEWELFNFPPGPEYTLQPKMPTTTTIPATTSPAN
jgi:hypothetical protein